MARQVTAEIICIGDELLIGQTVDTNTGRIGRMLSMVGIKPVRGCTVPDEREAMLMALGRATADVVLITGGLGPTRDDITKQVLCSFFGTRLVRNAELVDHVTRLLTQHGRRPQGLLTTDLEQADVPETCTVLHNPLGTACGMWFEVDGRVYISMPGVPFEMEAIMLHGGIRRLQEHFDPPVIIHRTVHTTGIGESQLAARIALWEEETRAKGIALAYLPSPGVVKLRLSIHPGDDGTMAAALVEERLSVLRSLVPELIFGEGDTTLPEAVGGLLRERGATLALAESCTGGGLSAAITAVPGSSDYFIGGVVSYANAVKMEELGVPGDMLELNGAVSRPVVERMATGVRQALGSSHAVATSGVAGPGGGTPEKPVGMVWIAVAGPLGVRSQVFHFSGTRGLVIERATMAALGLLRKDLIGLP